MRVDKVKAQDRFGVKMMMKKAVTLSLMMVAASVVALAGSSSSASADIVSVTYSGTVSGVSTATGNTDSLNLFGGGTLVGDSFQTVFTFDTTKGLYTGSSLLSGATFGLSNAFLPTTVTINGVTQSLAEGTGGDTNNAGSASTGGNGVHEAVNGTSAGYEAGLNFGIGSTISATPVSAPLLTDDYTTTTNCFGCGSFGTFSLGGETINFSPTQAVAFDQSTTVASGAPEPATWAMMLLGFVGLGYLSYRRKAGLALVRC